MRFAMLTWILVGAACLVMLDLRPAAANPQSNANDSARQRKAAQGKPNRPGGQAGAARLKAELLKRFDANGNGQLDPDEMQAARAAAAKSGQGRNFDGVLQQELLKRFDKDGDGQLNAAEQKAARDALAKRNQGSRTGSKRQAEVLKEFDVNGNGRLDPVEKQAAKEASAKRAAAKRKPNGN